MSDRSSTAVATAGGLDAAEITSLFHRRAFREGRAALTAGDRPGDTMLIPSPSFRDRPDIRGRYGPLEGLHLRADSAIADVLAYDFASYVDPSDLRCHVNVIDPSVSGAATRASVAAVRGLAAKLSYRPAPFHSANDRTPWSRDHLRFLNAGVEPLYFLGFMPSECWAVLLLDNPDRLQGDLARQRAYDDLTRRFAETVGGGAADEPLLTTLPLPGACRTMRRERDGRATYMENRCLDPILLGGRGRPAGTRFEDLEAAVARIEATPRLTIAA